MTNNLCSLQTVKAWVQASSGAGGTNDDLLLLQLIGQVSRFILNYLQRPSLFQFAYNDYYDGVNSTAILLRNWPVLSISSLVVGTQTITAAPAPITGYGSGYVLEPWDGLPPGRPQTLSLNGYSFCRGLSNINIQYSAGFVVQSEAQTVQSNSLLTPLQPNGSWGADQGVTYADGTPLIKVTSAPAPGQYTASPTTGMYSFNAADAGAAVLISYSYIPFDIEQACMEMVGERYSYRQRIGQSSKSLAGNETMAYSLKDMQDYIRTLLQPYRRVIQA